MAIYKVQLGAELTNIWIDIEVEASSNEEAEKRATEKAKPLRADRWETGDASVYGIEVVECKLIEAEGEDSNG